MKDRQHLKWWLLEKECIICKKRLQLLESGIYTKKEQYKLKEGKTIELANLLVQYTLIREFDEFAISVLQIL